MPLVTLIIPIYNAERYLRRCLDSVIGQSFTDMEVLLLNDGSHDKSLDICQEYEEKDIRFRVIDKENSGVSDTRNLGMRLARGKYLQFMDSDDWLTPDATESLVEAAEEGDCDLVIADFYRVSGKRYLEKRHIEKEYVMSRKEFAMEMADDPADFYYGVMWNKLYRRSVVVGHGLYCDASMNWCEDFLFNLHFIRYGERFRALQRPIYYYMKRKGSLVDTEAVSVDAVRMKFELLESYKDLYQSMGLYEEHKLKINSFVIAVARDGGVGRMNPNTRRLDPEDVILEAESGYQHVEHTFEPVYDEHSEILILGTFPSVKSREKNFYYGHPQNRFWKVLAKLTEEEVPETIEEKKELLLKHHIAIWDVVQSCDIKGSSDSSIRNVVPADLNRVLSAGCITRIFANGDKAYRLYKKYCQDMTGRPIEKLPSSSPANAIFTLDRLTDSWGEILYDRKEEKKMAFEKAKEYLKQFGLDSHVMVFDTSSATVELAAEAVGCEPARIAKTLSFQVGEDSILIVAAGDARIDNSKYKAQFHTKARMLPFDEVEEKIGHAVGGVCPFGVRDGVKVYLDESLKRFESVYPACGSNNSAVELTLEELEQASGYEAWIDVCK